MTPAHLLKLGADTTNQSAYIGCTQESGFDFTNFTSTKNQIATSGYSYDAAGNMIVAPGTGNLVYDAENHLLSTSGGGLVTYTYDGDGKRVQKSSGTLYWYDPAGNVLLETNASGGTLASYVFLNGKRVARWTSAVQWYATDHLGTSRYVFDGGANGEDISDFYPFGGERVIKSQFTNSYKFTGKERDSESGLDNFGARFDSSSLGRFASPDPYDVLGERAAGDRFLTYLSQPANWNRYAYVWGNPLHYVDPKGERVFVVAYSVTNEEGDDEFRRAAETRANDIAKSKDFDPAKDVILLAGVSSIAGLEKVTNLANNLESRFGKVQELSLFSHAGDRDGPTFNEGFNRRGGPRYANEQDANRIASLKVNWAVGGQAHFFGCYTADFAQKFANAQHVAAFGFDHFAGFSSTPQGRSYAYVFWPYSGSQLYMTHRDGRAEVRRDPEKPK